MIDEEDDNAFAVLLKLRVVAHCAQCGGGMMTDARPICGECDERARQEREGRRDALARWAASVPPRYQWAAGLDVPELRVRVRDARAIDAVRALGTRFERVALMGPAGVGKTVLSCALLHVVASAGTRVHFAEARELAHARAHHGLGRGEPMAVVEALRAGVLVIDDVGSEANVAQSAVADIIHARHAEGRATVVTLALDVAGTKARYGDGIARRLFESADIIDVGRAPVG